MAETSRWHRGLRSVDSSPRRLARAAARIGSSSARTRVARPCGPSELPSDRRQRAVMPGCQEKPSSQAGTRTCHWHLCPASPRDPLCARNRARKTRRSSKRLCGAARRRVCSLSTVARRSAGASSRREIQLRRLADVDLRYHDTRAAGPSRADGGPTGWARHRPRDPVRARRWTGLKAPGTTAIPLFSNESPLLLFGRTDWRIELGKAVPTRVVTQRREHRPRYPEALQARRDHDFERADGGGPDALQPVVMGPRITWSQPPRGSASRPRAGSGKANGTLKARATGRSGSAGSIATSP